MLPIRIKAVSESDLRMLGNLARNIQRVLPVTQADIDAAAALGKSWVVWKAIEVNDPIDNLRGGTQLVIKQNSIAPGENVRRVLIISGPSGQVVVIGPDESPLLLPDAIANTLSYVKAFGGTEQNGTPTPADPVDIVSNNGALKARHESGLPLGYTLLEYVESDGNQCIDTGLAGSITGNRYKIGFTRTGVSGNSAKGIIGTHNTTTPYNRSYIATTGNQWEFGYGNASRDGTVVNDTYYDIELDTTNSKYLFKTNGVVIQDVAYTGDRATANILIGCVYQISSTYCSIGKYHYAKIYGADGTTLLMNLIPARRNSDNVVGMYDTVSGTFLTNAGTGDFVAGTAVGDPVEIYTDGTVETIEDTIGNTATAEMLLSVDTYTDQQEVISGSITRKCGVVILDSSFEWTYDSTYGRVNATIPNLWGSTVARTIPGFCTHFEWLSHQESISSITAGQCYSAGANRIFLHISQTSAAAFAAWLDAQKDAGTPVIIVFPLENTTTETVTGQTLQVANGDNTLTITQAGINGLQLEAEYEKAV